MAPGNPPPGNPLVAAANEALLNPGVRAQVRQLHAEGAPLVAMVEALGLDGEMSQAIRGILAGLPAQVVADIRAATLAMLDTDTYSMPLDCNVTDAQVDAGAPLRIDVVDEPDPTIRIRLRDAPN